MKFKEIFEGNKSAYGQLILSGQTTDKGKAVGKAFIKREPIPDTFWQDHLDGKEPALGVIPINENNECRWGCIDVDDYKGLDHKKIIASIKSHKFPLVTFRSKSGGAHLFLFSTEYISAGLMQSKLKMMSEALGFGGSEIFPKQTEILAERGDVGNFLNLPYHGGARGLRYTFDEQGNAASLESFYSIYDEWAQTKVQIEVIAAVKKVEKNEAFKDGPPCLNRLAEEGFGEGSRNNALFNIAVYHKQANPDNWEDKVMEDNTNWMSPSLGYQEVKALLTSVNKRGYDKYRCKDQPICGVCDAKKCRTKKFGVGFEEEQMPEIKNLTKINSDPPQWFLNVEEARISLNSLQLYKPDLFALACLDQANKIVPVFKGQVWRTEYVKPLIDSPDMQTIDALESLSPQNQIENHLYEFTRNLSEGKKLDDIVNGVPFTDEEQGITYFRLDDFYAYLKRCNWELDKTKTGNLIKRLTTKLGHHENVFIEEARVQVRTSRPRVIKIKALEKLIPKVSENKWDDSPF